MVPWSLAPVHRARAQQPDVTDGALDVPKLLFNFSFFSSAACIFPTANTQ